VQPQAISVPVVFASNTASYVSSQPFPQAAFAQATNPEQWQEPVKDEGLGVFDPNAQMQFEPYNKAQDRQSQMENPLSPGQYAPGQQPAPGSPGQPQGYPDQPQPGQPPMQPAPGSPGQPQGYASAPAQPQGYPPQGYASPPPSQTPPQ